MKREPTDSEIEVLSLIWQQGPLSVRQVHDQIKKKRAIGYTTTLKIMQIMYGKGMLERCRQGKSHIYDATVPSQDIQDSIISHMVNRVFYGSVKDLVIQALGSAKSPKEELAEIRCFLDKLDSGQN
jgi:BlaI family transcriptional regulator, penicillinase repressor